MLQTFVDGNRYWTNGAFETEIFGQDKKVAAFGSFTYRSNAVGKQVTSAVAILARVLDGKIAYMQLMEDTLANSRWYVDHSGAS